MDVSNSEAMEALLNGIQYLVEQSVASAPFDKVKNGKVLAINLDGTYRVAIEGKTYNIPALGNSGLVVNSIVKVLIPQNEYSSMFILNAGTGSSGLSGAVTDFWAGTLTDYNALLAKNSTTLYLIKPG